MLPIDPADTIAAVASPPGPGWRGIVRLSGPRAWAAALAGFRPDAGTDPDTEVHRARRLEGRFRLAGLRPALSACVQLWPGPRTYTGQPLAEIHMPGNPSLVGHLLAHVLAHGARLAGPGEFTLRAFLAGRLDLTRAEAVLGVIDARNPAQLDAALRQLAGGLFGPVAALRDRLLDSLAHLEANLDFVDEPDVAELGRAELAGLLTRASAEVHELARRLDARERPTTAPSVVLVGPPNAGKSRLFNALAGSARALVSPRPGTTRDYLEAPCVCDGITVRLVDTAGHDTAGDAIEARAQALRVDQAELADLLLVCTPLDSPDPAPTGNGLDRPRLDVRTRADLAPGAATPAGSVVTSAVTGAGLDHLRRAVGAALRVPSSESDLPATTGARCRDSLIRAGEALAAASTTLAIGGGDELVAIDLRQALDDLGRVVGAVVTDDILDRIFHRFCIGK